VIKNNPSGLFSPNCAAGEQFLFDGCLQLAIDRFFAIRDNQQLIG
jgi:hypothetical protein